MKEIILEFSILVSFSTLTRSLHLTFGKCHICIYPFIKSLVTVTFYFYKKSNFKVQFGSEVVSYPISKIRSVDSRTGPERCSALAAHVPSETRRVCRAVRAGECFRTRRPGRVQAQAVRARPPGARRLRTCAAPPVRKAWAEVPRPGPWVRVPPRRPTVLRVDEQKRLPRMASLFEFALVRHVSFRP